MVVTFTDLDIILFILVLGIGWTLTIFLCYFLIPFTNRLKFINKLIRKNFGVVEVAGKGGEIDRYMVNFDKRIGETSTKVFLLNQDLVYRKDGIKYIHFNELDALDPVDFIGEPIERNKIDMALESVGIVDENVSKDLKSKAKQDQKTKKFYLYPVSFKKLKPKEEYKNPEMIKGVFMEQKALAEAKALLSDKMMRYLLIGACICSGLAFASSFMLNDKFDNEIVPVVKQTSAGLGEINSQLSSIITKVDTILPAPIPSGYVVLPNGTVVR